MKPPERRSDPRSIFEREPDDPKDKLTAKQAYLAFKVRYGILKIGKDVE